MKNVLLISPTWVGLHDDIIRELEREGHHVEFIPEYSFKKDPLKVKKGWTTIDGDKADKLKSDYWRKQLGKTKTVFAYLLVIDGQGINQYLFEELRKRNPSICCVNYLYDTTYGFYHFDRNFQHFDRVFSFDKKDAAENHIGFLPIYWTDTVSKRDLAERYQIFGFGAYSENRFRLFRQIQEIAKESGKSYYIKLYYPRIKNLFLYRLTNFLRKAIGKPRPSIPLKLYKSDFITNAIIATEDYRNCIYSSDVILDTKVQNQDGLTARFMWALGAEKKIITTNEAVKTYEFYNPEQILVVRDGEFDDKDKNIIRQFLKTDFHVSTEEKERIKCYRIDEWLKTMFVK